jgi:thiamine-monophosphate kinase
MTRPDEDGLIARYLAPIAGAGGLGLLDDAALVTVPEGRELVITADAIVSGIHFLPDDPPASIARKALGINLSDLAAKGADPLGFVLTLALPEDWTEEWLAAFCDALGAASRGSGCALLGGDTVRAGGPLTLSITALGTVPAGRMVRRTGAREGDVIAVTGTIGNATLGLALAREPRPLWAWALEEAATESLVDRYRHPRPRLVIGPALRDHAHAAMDVSDGFSGDLAKMLRASGVGASVDLDRVPLSGPVRAALAAEPLLFEQLVTGGDDYEIVLTASPDDMRALERQAQEVGLPLTVVGVVGAPGSDVTFWRAGRPFDRAGSYTHFEAGHE